MATLGARKQKESHIERTAKEPRQKELLQARLSHITQVNRRVRLFRLELTSGPVRFLPGQWLDTFVPGVPKAGGFTITSSPSAALQSPSPYLELADQITGSMLQVRIGGSFVFPPEGLHLASIQRVVFVAGGVGVNPLISMLSYLSEGEGLRHTLDTRFLYATKVPEGNSLGEILFLDTLASLFGQGKLRGYVKLFITGDGTTKGTHEVNGTSIEIEPRRLSIADLEAAIGNELLESTVVYVCGPPTMTDEVVSGLTSLDGLSVNPQHVLAEKWW
ncbi:Oxidoreductase NAD-binding domain-containing protein 1 [Cladobotryum mycophilum]|uniref:Oxidoreductase NAD-binding domain-containing protein 1 n=1 Tax=Cladobotryum mycophilum TaxID=491253 RepID=A0ABR0SUL4_9HYPO